MALRKPKHKRTRGAVTAATASVDLSQSSSWRSWKFTTEQWQQEAWRLYDLVPEHRFLANWIGESVAQARLSVVELDEHGEETGETQNAQVQNLAAEPLGSGSRRDDNLRLLGIDLAVPGEAFIVGESARNLDQQDNWFVVTSNQIEKRGSEIIVRKSMLQGGGALTIQNGRDMLIRCWRPHPSQPDQPDSPTRAAIPALREIESLTKREFAELDSRLTGAGILPLPEGVDFPRGEDDPEGIAGFMAYMNREVAKSMQDQSSASAMVPHFVTVPDHMYSEVRDASPINFWSALSEKVPEMKTAAIQRVGSAFEVPTEILTGMAAANHWTAWAIGEEGIKRIRSYLAYIADSLTRGYLWPALESLGFDPEQARQFVFQFDTSPLAVRPNRIQDGLDMWDRNLLSNEAAVSAGAFSEGEMPSREERNERLLVKLVEQSPQLLSDPAIRNAIGLNIDISPPPAQPPTGEPPAPPSNEDDPGDTEDPPDGPGNGPPDGEASSRDGVAAAELLVLRELERANNMLVPHKDRANYADVARHEMHTRIGPLSTERVNKIVGKMDGPYPQVVAEALGADRETVVTSLDNYMRELLTRGMAHSRDMLSAVVARVVRDAA